MTIKTTRTDCTRDNVAVVAPNATLLGFGTRKVKRGNWVVYESSDGARFVGRVISRVTCEGKVYVEIAQAAENFGYVYIRWIEPEQVKECRASPPRNVFSFFSGSFDDPETIHAQIEYGVSDMPDQLAARAD